MKMSTDREFDQKKLAVEANKMKMSTDRDFDQKKLAAAAVNLSLFLYTAINSLKCFEEYDKRRPIFSQVEKFGAHKVAEHIIAELIDDEVIDKRYQLASGVFLSLSVDDISSSLRGKIETATNVSNMVLWLKNDLEKFEIYEDENSEDDELEYELSPHEPDELPFKVISNGNAISSDKPAFTVIFG